MEPTAQTFENKRIVTELAKINVTETVLAKFKAEYLPLKIDGIEDKQGYEAVKNALKITSKARIETVKLCKKIREDAIAFQKECVAKEKSIVRQIEPVESHLSNEIDRIDKEIAAIKLREARLKQLPLRVNQLKGLEANVPTDDILLGMDDIQFMTYVNNERTRILNEREEAIRQKESERIEKESIFITGTPNMEMINNLNNPSNQFPKAGDTVIMGGGTHQGVFQDAGDGRLTVDMKYVGISDKDALTRFAEGIYNLQFPTVKGEEAQKIVEDSKKVLFDLAMAIMDKSGTINS